MSVVEGVIAATVVYDKSELEPIRTYPEAGLIEHVLPLKVQSVGQLVMH